MFLREGSQPDDGLRVICAAMLFMFTAPAVAGSAGGVPGVASSVPATAVSDHVGVEPPREVLPWRREAERKADEALDRARRELQQGRFAAGRAALHDLATRYPKTHSGIAARRRLAAMRSSTLRAASPRQGLGAPIGSAAGGQGVSVGGSKTEIDPIAGWKTHVRVEQADLRMAFVEAAGDRVFFENGSAKLSTRANRVLKLQARWLRTKPHVEARVEGHASDSGSATDNTRLSHDRAVAVRRQLIKYGVPARRLHVLSHGNAKPVAVCIVETCAKQNRRVVTAIRRQRQAAVR